MTQDDIDNGRLVCEIGLAPLRPAEFVIVRIGQWTAGHAPPAGGSDGDASSGPPYIALRSMDDRALLGQALATAPRAGSPILLTGADRNGRGEVARELARLVQLPLHRIDLARVVSKYISETEKNLGRIFGAAADGDALLFFDEADALFDKRTDVHDSHDRYANIETAYLLRRIETFRGTAVLATNRRSDIPATVRRAARFEVAAPESTVDATESLPDLSSGVDVQITSINLAAIQALYFVAMLEELQLLRVVDRLVELFMQGVLPLGANAAGARLSDYWQRGPSRSSDSERRDLYTRVFGMPGGGDGTTPNREFDALWTRFISAVALWSGQHPPDDDTLRASARELAVNLSLHGCALSLYAATDIGETIRDAIAILRDTDVQAAFGARDMWQVVDAVATRELGGARSAARYRTMAAAGATVIAWLATHLERLAAPSKVPMLELSESPLKPGVGLGATPLSRPTDADLVVACARWLEAAAVAPSDAGVSAPTRASLADAVPADLSADVRAMLVNVGAGAPSR